MPKYITQQQAADFLGVTPRTIRNLISRGVFTGYQVPGVRAVRVDLNEIAAKMRAIPTTAGREELLFGKPKFNGNVVRVSRQAVVVPKDSE